MIPQLTEMLVFNISQLEFIQKSLSNIFWTRSEYNIYFVQFF